MKALLMMLALSLVFVQETRANDNDKSATEQVKGAGRDAGRQLKKGAHRVKEKTCELVNGKMQCAAEKVGHRIDEAADAAKDKANDVVK